MLFCQTFGVPTPGKTLMELSVATKLNLLPQGCEAAPLRSCKAARLHHCCKAASSTYCRMKRFKCVFGRQRSQKVAQSQSQ